MKRREFITLLGGAAAWPLAARAQQGGRMRRIGALMPYGGANDAQGQARNAAFLQGLVQLGWVVGRNLLIDYRWTTGYADDNRRKAAELIELAPDALLAPGTETVGTLLQTTRYVHVVFVHVADTDGTATPDRIA